MRTRLIRPSFFSDETMGALSVPARLVYIGTWTLADDAGYLEWSPRQIAGELFRFDSPRHRENLVQKALAELIAVDRLRVLDCGRHAVIPTLTDHRIRGGEQLLTIQKIHQRRCSVVLRSPTDDYISVSVSDSSSVSDSLSADAPMKTAAIAAGGFVANLASRKH